MTSVYIFRVAFMGHLKDPLKRVLLIRNYQMMNVICHQRICQEIGSVTSGVVREQIEVYEAITFSKEDILSPGTTLCDVVRNVRNYNSASARHIHCNRINRAKVA